MERKAGVPETVPGEDPPRLRRGQIDPRLLELLACPLSKGPLTFDRERMELVSRAAKLAYPVRDGVPIMLVSQARPLEDDPPPPRLPRLSD